MWLFQKTSPEKHRELTLAKAHCAATVLHLMKDERSKNAIAVAIKYGNNEATSEELSAAYAAAFSAAYAAAYAAAAAARTKTNWKRLIFVANIYPLKCGNLTTKNQKQ